MYRSDMRAMSAPGLDKNPLLAARFFIEPVVAWRAWLVQDDDHHGVVLRSVTHKVRWPVRKPMRAHCLYQIAGKTGYLHPHEAPDNQHRCGVYSVKTPEQAEGWGHDWQSVGSKGWGHDWQSVGSTSCVGRVLLWGRVSEFTEGYLAEYAYPLSLMLANGKNEDLVAEAMRRYGCEQEAV